MRILAICGSLRAQSSNLTALRAAQAIARQPMQVVLFDGLTTLPYFNPDLDTDDPPPPVAAFRREIGLADALLICSPEYARGVAGVMKNGLDWLVGSFEFPGKFVAVINTSQRATHADAALKLTLETMSARIVHDACVTLPLLDRRLSVDELVADAELSGMIAGSLAELARVIEGKPRDAA